MVFEIIVKFAFLRRLKQDKVPSLGIETKVSIMTGTINPWMVGWLKGFSYTMNRRVLLRILFEIEWNAIECSIRLW